MIGNGFGDMFLVFEFQDDGKAYRRPRVESMCLSKNVKRADSRPFRTPNEYHRIDLKLADGRSKTSMTERRKARYLSSLPLC